MQSRGKEENILPPISRSRIQLDEKNTSQLTASTNKFKAIETSIWMHNGKQLLKTDEVTELDRRLSIELKAEKTNLTEYLIAMRRTYDEMIKKGVKKEKETRRLKEQIDSMKRQIDVLTRQSEIERKEMEGLSKNFETVKNKQQTSAMAAKTLEHILFRMKKDQITNHIKVNELEKRAKMLQSSINQSQVKKFQLNQFGALSTIAVQEVKASYAESSQKRKKDLQQYQNLISNKKMFELKSEERQKITDQIQAVAASDQNDSSLLKSKKLLMAQLLLKCLLKSKINGLDKKYEEIKSAFHTIKIKTTIDDPQQLSFGYFQLENNYLELVKNVKTLEERQKGLLQQKQQYKKKLQVINNQYNGFESLETPIDQHDLLKSMKQISERTFHARFIEEKMFSWIIENKFKMQSIKNKKINKKKYIQAHQKGKIGQYFQEFCQELVKEAESLESSLSQKINYEDLQNLEAVTTKRSELEEDDLILVSSVQEVKRTIRI